MSYFSFIEWPLEAHKILGRVVATARQRDRCVIVAECDEGWRVTKIRGGVIRDERVFRQLPSDVRQAIKEAHRGDAGDSERRPQSGRRDRPRRGDPART